ncbi:hypothetical protein [Streptomyces sp. NPDC003635]
MSRELHLSIELDGTGHGHAAPFTDTHWTDLFELAEQGALDFVAVADHVASLDAVAALARVAPLTSRIGLVPAVAAPRGAALHTSSALANLELASEGRAGWLVDASANGAEAAEVTEAAVRLWDRPENDAEHPAAAADGFTDRERPPLVGEPSPGTRPPQGRLPIAVALDAHDSDGQWELAASHAELVLLDADQPSTARLAPGSTAAPCRGRRTRPGCAADTDTPRGRSRQRYRARTPPARRTALHRRRRGPGRTARRLARGHRRRRLSPPPGVGPR